MNEALIQAAQKAFKNAYVPYSNFPVGAAILLKDGTIHTGANIENGSYGLTICAERACLAHAYSMGVRKDDIVAMAIATPQKEVVTPCGACRQVISEQMGKDKPIHMVSPEKSMTYTINELLPFLFDAEDFDL